MISLFFLGFIVFMVASAWKVFEKAGEPGWAALIPFFNIYIGLKIAEKPGWWLFLFFVPLVGLITSIIVAIDIAKAFGKDVGFGLGLAFLPFVCLPMLAFGDAEYVGTEGMPMSAKTDVFSQTVHVADEIHKLDLLFKQGTITFEEFEKRKKRLLG